MGRSWTPVSLDREGFDRQYKAALEAGEIGAVVEPRAASACYDPRIRTLVLQLRDGTSVAVPVSTQPELAHLEDDVTRAIRVTASGYGLHWDNADIHLAVPVVIDRVPGRG